MKKYILILALLQSFQAFSQENQAIVITGAPIDKEAPSVPGEDLGAEVFDNTSTVAANGFQVLGYNVTLLQQPTNEELEKAINAANRHSGKNGKIAIHFTAHGKLNKKRDDTEILLSNRFTWYKRDEGVTYLMSSYPNKISGKQLDTILDNNVDESKKVFMIFQSCSAEKLLQTLKGKNRTILSASDNTTINDLYLNSPIFRLVPDQDSRLSVLDPNLFKGTSIFTSILFAGILCEADEECFQEFDYDSNNQISLEEIVEYSNKNLNGRFQYRTARRSLFGGYTPVKGARWKDGYSLDVSPKLQVGSQ